MSEMKTLEEQKLLQESAAYWAMRLALPECGPQERADFEKWCARSPANVAAFEKTERSLAVINGHLSHPVLVKLVDEVLEQTEPVPTIWQRWAIPRVAAGFFLIIAVTGLMFISSQQWGGYNSNIKVYDTVVGERSIAILTDGSTIVLNTNSRIEVDYNSSARRVVLVRGQAWFEVEKNSSWPFVVEAGNQRITALGTAFDVRLDGGKAVQVVLVEGRVAVDELSANVSDSKQQSIPHKRIELVAGDRLIASAQAMRMVDRVSLEEVTSWRDGRIVFNGKPLSQAIIEVNRYSRDQIRLSEDRRLRDLPISGVFRTGRTESFLFALKTMHSVDFQRTEENEITLIWNE